MQNDFTVEAVRTDFEKVIERYQKPILNFIYRMVRNEETAMDLSQDVFIKAYQARHRFDGRSKVSTWLFTIATNHTRDFFRKKRPEVVAEIDEQRDAHVTEHGESASPERNMFSGEIRDVLEEALDQLTPEYREPVVMRHINDMSVAEISAALNIPVGTVKTRLFRGREKLQKILIKTWGTPS